MVSVFRKLKRVKNVLFTKQVLFVLLLSLLGLLFVELQFILGILRTPTNTVYLGSVHYPPDYFGYLSFIAQGKDHLFSSRILYTSENLPFTFFRWQFVLLGKLFSVFPIHTGFIYQIAVIVTTILFFLSAYWLLSLLFTDVKKRILAFFFFLSANAWPSVALTSYGFSFGYHTYWYNNGNFFVRFGSTPHHLLGSLLLTLGLALMISWIKKEKLSRSNYVMYGLSGLFLGFNLTSISPMQWVLLFITAGASAFFILLKKLYQKEFHKKIILTIFYPFITFVVGGIPIFLYLEKIYGMFPYNSANAWEANQLIHFSVLDFFYANGLMFVFALIGLGLFFFQKKWTKERLVLLIFLMICLWFFSGSATYYMHVTNIRFWPQALYVFLGALASEGLILISRLYKKDRDFLIFLILLLYICTLIPSYILQIKERIGYEPTNLYTYLPKDIYDSFMQTSLTVPRPSVFILDWPLNYIFPALTGHISYVGDPISHMTIDAQKKNEKLSLFLRGVLSEDEAYAFVRDNNIHYIYRYRYLGVPAYSFIQADQSNPGASIQLYRIQ